MSDYNSNGLIARRNDEEQYASVLQLARRLNASPAKQVTPHALNFFNALQSKRELLPIAVAASGLVGIVAMPIVSVKKYPMM